MFNIGDIVKLKDNLGIGIYEQFAQRKIYKDSKLKIFKISVYFQAQGLGFEGGWEKNDFADRFFELATNRKERIDNLYKEIEK